MGTKYWMVGTTMLALLFAVNSYGVAFARGLDGGGHGGNFGAHIGGLAGHLGMGEGLSVHGPEFHGGNVGEGMPEHFESHGDFSRGPAFHEGLAENHFNGGLAEENHERGEYHAYRPYDYDRDYVAPFGFRFAWPFVYGGLSYGYPYGYDNYYGYGYPGYTYGYQPYTYYNYSAPTVVEPSASTDGATYLTRAEDAFRRGDYQGALRWAAHASIDMPKDAKTHQLMSLASLALGDYRGASAEAHAALALGPAPNWMTTQAFYANPNDYTSQLRSLEAFARDNPTAGDAQFLLGYEYLMLGHPDEAKTQFAAAAANTPQDQLAQHMVEQLGGTAAASTAKAPAPTITK